VDGAPFSLAVMFVKLGAVRLGRPVPSLITCPVDGFVAEC